MSGATRKGALSGIEIVKGRESRLQWGNNSELRRIAFAEPENSPENGEDLRFHECRRREKNLRVDHTTRERGRSSGAFVAVIATI